MIALHVDEEGKRYIMLPDDDPLMIELEELREKVKKSERIIEQSRFLRRHRRAETCQRQR